MKKWVKVVMTSLLLLGALPLLSGCSGEHRARRQDAQQQEYLQECATNYWHAVRWRDLQRAVVFLRQPEEQRKLASVLIRDPGPSLHDVQIYHLVFDTEKKEATAFVKYELLSNRTATLEPVQLEQTWYLSQGRCYLKLGEKELDRWLE
ncbi:MAG: hypothetical protein ACKO6N_06825 [Myxococcota bacterium]